MGRTTTMAMVLAGLWLSAPASASVYGDDLSRCLVKSTSAADRDILIRWVFATMSVTPQVSRFASLTPEDRATFRKETAQIMERLVLSDCRKESVDAMKYDGASAIQTSFSLVGQVAMHDLMTNAAAAAEMEKFASYLDATKWKELGKDAGISPPDAPAVEKAK